MVYFPRPPTTLRPVLWFFHRLFKEQYQKLQKTKRSQPFDVHDGISFETFAERT